MNEIQTEKLYIVNKKNIAKTMTKWWQFDKYK